MAVGTPTVFDLAMKKLVDGTIDLDTHTFKAILTSTAQALTSAFAGGSGFARKADLTAEFTTGGNYTAGGQALTGVTLTQALGVTTWDAADVVWANLTLANVAYLVIYDDTAAQDDLLLFVELSVGGSVSPTAVDLSMLWNALGIFTVTRV